MKPFYPIFLIWTLAITYPVSGQQSSPVSATSSVSLPPASVSQASDSTPDPLLDVPPMPKGDVTLVGGTVKHIDRLRDRLLVQAFGGTAMRVAFDERTHIYRDGVETTQLGIRPGDRVYVDTMLDGSRVFARNIRVETGARVADTSGQVLSINARHGTITLRDQVLAQPVTVLVDQKTSVLRDKQPVSFSDLSPGALVTVRFSPERAHGGVAREIQILAAPGMRFTFAGKVTFIDLRSGILSLENLTDGKTYDLNFSLRQVDKRDVLRIGCDVTVLATFERTGYQADSVIVNTAPAPASTNQ
jgi:Domain of unknown function (DUF5666)